MNRTDIETQFKTHPETVFSGPHGYYRRPQWNPAQRAFDADFENEAGYKSRRTVRSSQLVFLCATDAEYVAYREQQEKDKAVEAARRERKKQARLREVQFLLEHESTIRSTIGRVLGVRPEDIETDSHRGTVSINVAATVAVAMLDRLNR